MPVSLNPVNQPIVDAIAAYFAATGETSSELCRKVYGYDEKQKKAKGSGTIYPLINGALTPSHAVRERIAAAGGPDLRAIRPLPGEGTTARGAPKRGPGRPKKQPQVKEMVAAYSEAVANGTALAPIAPTAAPRRALAGTRLSIVARYGDAVMLSLDDVSASEAVSALNALIAAGVLK